MTDVAKPAVPAVEGWFTEEPEPRLVGYRCPGCATYAFPKPPYGCPNPDCLEADLDQVPLSRTGTVWSYTNACYEPPAPYIAPGDEHEPFCIAAVHLQPEEIVVLGQVVAGVEVTDLAVGQEVELVIDTLFEDDDAVRTVWKWRPTDA